MLLVDAVAQQFQKYLQLLLPDAGVTTAQQQYEDARGGLETAQGLYNAWLKLGGQVADPTDTTYEAQLLR